MNIQLGAPTALQMVNAQSIQVNSTTLEARVILQGPLTTLLAPNALMEIHYDPGTGITSVLSGTFVDYNFTVSEQQLLATPGTSPSPTNPMTTKVISSGWLTMKLTPPV